MPLEVKIRPSCGAVSRGASIVVLALVVAALFAASAAAQTGEPIKIGYGMALTGGLAANGKSALLAQKNLGRGYQCERRTARPSREAHLL